jgi:hypothetical protein
MHILHLRTVSITRHTFIGGGCCLTWELYQSHNIPSLEVVVVWLENCINHTTYLHWRWLLSDLRIVSITPHTFIGGGCCLTWELYQSHDIPSLEVVVVWLENCINHMTYLHWRWLLSDLRIVSIIWHTFIGGGCCLTWEWYQSHDLPSLEMVVVWLENCINHTTYLHWRWLLSDLRIVSITRHTFIGGGCCLNGCLSVGLFRGTGNGWVFGVGMFNVCGILGSGGASVFHSVFCFSKNLKIYYNTTLKTFKV